MRKNGQSKIVAIVGGSGAGKTWLAGRLQRAFGSQAARLSLDDFYHDLGHLLPSARERTNFDHPQTIDWPAFEAVLRHCRAGRNTRVPQYDFTTHTRLPAEKPLVPTPLILVEGLWLLWLPQLAGLFDLKIFLDCPAQLRLERRLERDLAERGRTPGSIREQFSKTVAPMHEQFVVPQARWADIILQQPPEEMALAGLIQTIQSELFETHAKKTTASAREELLLQTA